MLISRRIQASGKVSKLGFGDYRSNDGASSSVQLAGACNPPRLPVYRGRLHLRPHRPCRISRPLDRRSLCRLQHPSEARQAAAAFSIVF
jgi:hypothetical protein